MFLVFRSETSFQILLTIVLFTDNEVMTFAEVREIVEMTMCELGNPNETLEQRLERRKREDPDLDLVPTDDEDDILEGDTDITF